MLGISSWRGRDERGEIKERARTEEVNDAQECETGKDDKVGGGVKTE